MTILSPQRRQSRQRPGPAGRTVTTVIGGRIRAAGLELSVSARFGYDTASPDLIRLSFQPGLGKPADAGLAIPRPLLSAGLDGPAADGNTRVRTSAGGRILVIRLSSPDGTAEFDVPAASVVAFLDAAVAGRPRWRRLASGGPR